MKYIGKYFSAERILTSECRLTMISAGKTKTYTVKPVLRGHLWDIEKVVI